jgi:hypothetical protein
MNLHRLRKYSDDADARQPSVPVTCPECGETVTATAAKARCAACGVEFDLQERLLEEHGPEVFASGGVRVVRDLSGPTLVIEAFCVVVLAAILLVIIHRILGGYGLPALILTIIYWTSYGIVRKRSSHSAAPDLIRQFCYPNSDVEPDSPAT